MTRGKTKPETWMELYLERNTKLQQEILNEIKGLRKDLKEKRQLTPASTVVADEMKPFLEQYQKTITDAIPKIFPNLIGSSSISCGAPPIGNSQTDELKKYLADYVKEMTKSEVLEHMPDNLKGAYMRLVQSIIKPNDPIFSDEEQQKPDPREPFPFIAEEMIQKTADGLREPYPDDVHQIMYGPSHLQPKSKKETVDDKYKGFKDLEKKYGELHLTCAVCNEMIPNNELVISKDENLHRKCYDVRNIKNESKEEK